MNKKNIIIAVVAVLVLYIIYHFMIAHKAASAINPFATPPAVQAPAAKPQAPAAPVESADQKLIDSYTAQISAGKTNNGDTYFQRGIVYLRMQQNRDAINDFTTALKIVPKQPYILYNRALAYGKENMLDEAMADLTAAIAMKSDFADALNTRGLLYVAQDDYGDALADYKSALAINPKFSDVYFNMGTLYVRQKKYDDAIKAFGQAISTNAVPAGATPDQIAQAKKNLMESYLNRANAEMETNALQAALQDATYVITSDPNNVQAYRVRSAIYDRMGNAAAAANDAASADTMSMQQLMDNN